MGDSHQKFYKMKKDKDGYTMVDQENARKMKERSIKHHPCLTPEEREKQLKELDELMPIPSPIENKINHRNFGLPVIEKMDADGNISRDLKSRKEIIKWEKAAMSSMKVALLNNYGNVGKACEVVGITRNMHFKFMKTNRGYASFVAELNEAIIDNAENALLELVSEKNVQAVLFTLKTKGKERGYIEKKDIHIDHEIRFEPDRTIELNPNVDYEDATEI